MPTGEPPKTARTQAPKARAARAKAENVVPITDAVGQAKAAKPRVRAVAANPVTDAAVAAASPATAASPVAKSGVAKSGVAKSGSTLKLRDLTGRVEALTGGKKKAVRQTVEAVLTVIGHALMAGDDLNLPPLGRARVSRQRDREDGEILIIRLKRASDTAGMPAKAGGKAAKEALATEGEES